MSRAVPRRCARTTTGRRRCLRRFPRPGRRRRSDRAHGHRRRTHQGLHPRNDRRRRRHPRLRQRRLARHFSRQRRPPRAFSERHAAGEPSVSKSRRRHVRGRHREGRRRRTRVGTGRLRRRLRQRRRHRSVRHLLRRSGALSQQRRRHLHRRHPSERLVALQPTLEYRSGIPRLRSRRPSRSVRLGVRRVRRRDPLPARKPRRLLLEGTRRDVRPARSGRLAEHALSRQRRRHLQRRVRDGRPPDGPAGLRLHAARPRLRQRSAGPTSTSPTTPARRCSSTTTATERSRTSACRRASRSRPTAAPRPAWASAPATTTATAGSTSSRRTSTTTRLRLYRNLGGGAVRRCDGAAGLAVNTRYLGWGTGFLDVDLDSWPDIFIVNGHVYPEADRIGGHYSYEQPKLLYRNLGNGRFEDVSMRAGPALLEKKAARGAAFGDLFNTGHQDIVVNNMHDAPTLLHNCAAPAGHSLVVRAGRHALESQRDRRAGHGVGRPAGGSSTRCAAAAASVRTTICGSTSVSASADRGDRIEVAWPSGACRDDLRRRCGSAGGHSRGQRRGSTHAAGAPARWPRCRRAERLAVDGSQTTDLSHAFVGKPGDTL